MRLEEERLLLIKENKIQKEKIKGIDILIINIRNFKYIIEIHLLAWKIT